jgi:hypothetical protein
MSQRSTASSPRASSAGFERSARPVGAVVRQLGRHEDVFARHATVPDGAADLALVAVNRGRVEVAVADIEGVAHRSVGLPSPQLPRPQAEKGQPPAGTQRRCWHRHARQGAPAAGHVAAPRRQLGAKSARRPGEGEGGASRLAAGVRGAMRRQPRDPPLVKRLPRKSRTIDLAFSVSVMSRCCSGCRKGGTPSSWGKAGSAV